MKDLAVRSWSAGAKEVVTLFNLEGAGRGRRAARGSIFQDASNVPIRAKPAKRMARKRRSKGAVRAFGEAGSE